MGFANFLEFVKISWVSPTFMKLAKFHDFCPFPWSKQISCFFPIFLKLKINFMIFAHFHEVGKISWFLLIFAKFAKSNDFCVFFWKMANSHDFCVFFWKLAKSHFCVFFLEVGNFTIFTHENEPCLFMKTSLVCSWKLAMFVHEN